MGYYLEVGEGISDGIKRIILECIDEAYSNLTDPEIDRDEGVHDARKGFKQIRAALRFVRDEIGEAVYRRENIWFRDCGRLLASARDSFVLVETLDGLTAHYSDQLRPNAYDSIRENLLNRYYAVSREVLHESETVETVRKRLFVARERVFDLRFEGEDFVAINKGLRRVYKRGCRARDRASKKPTPEVFHEWRKRVKYLWHLIEILSVLEPAIFEKFANDLHQLSDYLGDDHDLVVLRLTLVEEPQLVNNRELLAPLFTFIEQRRSELELDALLLGNELYFDKPKTFIGRIVGYWEKWQVEKDSIETS